MTTNEANSPAEIVEYRIGMKPIPDNINAMLNECQRLTISRLESFGWTIKFVRRFPLETPIVVLSDPSGKNVAILDEDGNLDKTTPLRMR